MNNRPHFKDYIMAKSIAVSVAFLVIFSMLSLYFIPHRDEALIAISILALGFSFFIFFIYRGAKQIQRELVTINRYLKNLEKIDKIDYKTHFYISEFEEINQNLIKVLKSAKKREDIKQRYNAKLKLKNRQRADMIAAIAHEFRNPIASIMGYAQTLQDDLDIPKPLREKFLNKIYNNGNKIETLLSRLIMWNKFESKEANLYKSKFDIYRLANDVKQTLEESYKDRKIELLGRSREVEADRTLIEVVLKNLVENALKYSKETVIIDIQSDVISVIDRGVGLKKREIDKVTKKFYRSGVHSWDNSMGLGLSIVKTILKMHKTKLDIVSKEKEGSIFSFII
jgi:signal transduction histidine kinase